MHLQSNPAYCRLALAFISSSSLVKFRAMVEDWSCREIAEAIGSARRPLTEQERTRA